MSKPVKPTILLLALLSLLTACATSRDVLYLQDIDKVQLHDLATRYEAVIKKDDELKIIITSADKTVTDPYNFTIGEVSSGFTTQSDPETPIMSCIVDACGDISFPILGRIHVEGMTRTQLIDYLKERISADVKDPIIYVSFKNYKFTVLGEVRKPGTYTYGTEKLTILQALGYAGDLGPAARRDGIILIREVDGRLEHVKIDLRASAFLDTEYYFLQQNDILYVPPSAPRLMASNIWSTLGTILSGMSVTIALLSLIL